MFKQEDALLKKMCVLSLKKKRDVVLRILLTVISFKLNEDSLLVAIVFSVRISQQFKL